jgi:hypothetical protein
LDIQGIMVVWRKKRPAAAPFAAAGSEGSPEPKRVEWLRCFEQATHEEIFSSRNAGNEAVEVCAIRRFAMDRNFER